MAIALKPFPALFGPVAIAMKLAQPLFGLMAIAVQRIRRCDDPWRSA